MDYNTEDIVTLKEVAKKLRLDPRAVKRVAFAMGGKRFGNRWRFKWGSVLEYFSNAYFENGQGKPLDGASGDRRQTGSLSDVSTWKETRPGMAGCKRMGGGATRTVAGEFDDPHGLRKAYALGG